MLSRRRMLGGLAAAMGASVAGTAQAANRIVLNAADVHVDGYPTVAAVRWMGETLARESNGELGLNLFHAGQLGREADTLTLVRHEALAMTRVTTASLNNAVPFTRVLSLPYVFDDVAHFRRAVDSAPGQQVLDQFEQRGWIGLALYDGGERCIYSVRRPVHTPADLRGLKLRVPPSDLFMDVLGAYGANATPLPYGEVYSAMQSHLIDGAENNWPSFHSSRQFEVARYWSQTRHALTPDVLVMSARLFHRLGAAQQQLVRDVARRSVSVMRQAWDERVAQARDAVLAHGVESNEVDHDAFRAAAAPVLEKYLADPAMARLHADIRALA